MFCRQWTGTHALIKPTQVLRPPPMARQRIRGFAIACSCHFHRPSSSAIRAVLALFWKSTATPLFGTAFWRLRRRWEKLCFSSLRNMPNAGGYPRASQPDSKNNNFRPVQAMRPREADGVHHSSVHNSSRAQRAVSARGSSALDTGNVDHYGTA